MAISDLVRDIKANSTNFINENRLAHGKFCWQEGFGAFSYAHAQIQQVYNYILNQEEHHKEKTFRNEYQKGVINLIYTYNWLNERMKSFFEKEDITSQQFNILRILRGSYHSCG